MDSLSAYPWLAFATSASLVTVEIVIRRWHGLFLRNHSLLHGFVDDLATTPLRHLRLRFTHCDYDYQSEDEFTEDEMLKYFAFYCPWPE